VKKKHGGCRALIHPASSAADRPQDYLLSTQTGGGEEAPACPRGPRTGAGAVTLDRFSAWSVSSGAVPAGNIESLRELPWRSASGAGALFCPDQTAFAALLFLLMRVAWPGAGLRCLLPGRPHLLRCPFALCSCGRGPVAPAASSPSCSSVCWRGCWQLLCLGAEEAAAGLGGEAVQAPSPLCGTQQKPCLHFPHTSESVLQSHRATQQSDSTCASPVPKVT
jgi:hypothetical protein